MKQKEDNQTPYSKYGRKLRGFHREPQGFNRNISAKYNTCQEQTKKQASCGKTNKKMVSREGENKDEQQARCLMMEILLGLRQKIEMACGGTMSPSKYLSKRVFQKITGNEEFGKLSMNQDQKKSMECNLIYNILKFVKWEKIMSYFKKNRSKVKVLKVSRFKQYVISGKLFQKEENKNLYEVSANMIEEATFLISDSDALLKHLFLKKAYTKLFKQSVEKYKEKMTVFIYKIHQFTELLSKQRENILKSRTQNGQAEFEEVANNMEKLVQTEDSFERLGEVDEVVNTDEQWWSGVPEMGGSGEQFSLSQPIPLVDYFMQEINLTGMQKCSIFQDINHEIQSQENSYPLQMI